MIGAVLIPGAKAPRLIEREDLGLMKPGSVIIDVAIDQGGCVETSRPTTHSEPTFMVDEVLHYCVTNMPGAVGRTSTYALCNVTLPWVLAIANRGIERAAEELPPVARSINIIAGEVTNEAVARTFGLPHSKRWDKAITRIRGTKSDAALARRTIDDKVRRVGSEICVRLALTIVAGGLIGFNREEHGRAAGLCTMILVCLAASVSMILVNLMMATAGRHADSFIMLDLMRLPSGILSGMGFIGAGRSCGAAARCWA